MSTQGIKPFIVRWPLKKCPTGRNKYNSRLGAESVLSIVEDKVLKGPGRVINCNECSGWHITKLSAS